MSRAARALGEARDSLGAADLEDEVDGREVDAEVQGRSGDDGPQLPRAKAALDLVALLLVEGAVVQGDAVFLLVARVAQRLVPALGLAPRVGEDERAGGGIELGRDLVEQA